MGMGKYNPGGSQLCCLAWNRIFLLYHSTAQCLNLLTPAPPHTHIQLLSSWWCGVHWASKTRTQAALSRKPSWVTGPLWFCYTLTQSLFRPVKAPKGGENVQETSAGHSKATPLSWVWEKSFIPFERFHCKKKKKWTNQHCTKPALWERSLFFCSILTQMLTESLLK